MKFRPCIDIHDGRVKQIVGGSLSDAAGAVENFVSVRKAADYASLFKHMGLYGGHVIMLNSASSPMYGATKAEALSALSAFPGGMSAGGGINPDNAKEFLDAGASQVIVTSYIFRNGEIDEGRLEKMSGAVGKERLILDLSCRLRDGRYYVVTNRWQTFTSAEVDESLLLRLSGYCSEFLVHGVDAEGKRSGFSEELVALLGKASPIPVTYAGGIATLGDIGQLRSAGGGRVDGTIGSALDIYGGSLPIGEAAAAFD